MARIRSIKPEFWDHAQLNRASLLARLTFVGLINFADDQGRGRADEDWLWGRLHSGQHPNVRRTWSACIKELSDLRDDDGPLVIFYRVATATYYWLPGFCRQQYIEKPSKSKLPPPPDSGTFPRLVGDESPLDQGSGIKDQGREGRGGESPPPLASQLDAEEEKIRETVRMYAAWGFPPDDRKAEGICEMLAMGLSHEYIQSGAQVNKPADAGFWDIVKALKAGQGGNRGGRAVQIPGVEPPAAVRVNGNPTGYKPPVLDDRLVLVQKRRDEARAKCREILLAMDPTERERWAIEAKAAAEKERIFPAAVTSFIESQLLTRIAKENGIEGL